MRANRPSPLSVRVSRSFSGVVTVACACAATAAVGLKRTVTLHAEPVAMVRPYRCWP